MNAPRRFKKGKVFRVHLEGHPFPVDMVSIQADGYAAGGGLMLVMDRGDGEADRIVKLLDMAERDAVLGNNQA